MRINNSDLQNGFTRVGLFLSVLLIVGCYPEGSRTASGTMISGSGGIGDATESGGIISVQPQAGTEGWRDIDEFDGSVIEASTDLDGGACKAVTSLGKNLLIDVPVEVVVPAPIALYIMLDASLSMTREPPRWQPAVDALNEFLNNPDNYNIDIAFETFPLPPSDPQATVIRDNSDCSGTGYNEPAVPMEPLPDNATAIADHLITIGPNGWGTPLEAVLNGAGQYCAAYKNDKNANPEGEDCVVILITDGTPEILCNLDKVQVSDIAGQAYADTGVRFFPIGMAGADFEFLNMVGQKSNGDCTPDDGDATWACDVSQTGGAGLVEALEAIRDFITEMQIQTEMQEKILECEWALPEAPERKVLDYDMVNFQFTTGVDNPEKRIIGRVDSVDNCVPGEEAWYYDNMDEPTKILVCPDTCEAVRVEAHARIDILLGCDTIVVQ